MRKPMMSKTQNVCLIILSILFLLLGAIMVKQILDNKEAKEPEYHEIKKDSNMVNKALSTTNFSYCASSDLFIDKIYKGNVNDLNNSDKLNIVLKSNKDVEKITMEKINETLHSILDTNDLTKEDITQIISSKSLVSNYNLRFDGKVVDIEKNDEVCENLEYVHTNIIGAKENGVTLQIEVNLAFGKSLVNDEGIKVVDYYKDINKKAFVERLGIDDAGKVTWDKYSTYIMNYKIADENYLLQSIQKN